MLKLHAADRTVVDQQLLDELQLLPTYEIVSFGV